MQIFDNEIDLVSLLNASLSLVFKLNMDTNSVELSNTQPFSKIIMLNSSVTLDEVDEMLADLKQFIEATGNEMLAVNDQYAKVIQMDDKMEYSFRMILMSGAIEWLRAKGFKIQEELAAEDAGSELQQQRIIGIADILSPIHATLLKLNVNLDEFNATLAELNPEISEIYVDVIASVYA